MMSDFKRGWIKFGLIWTACIIIAYPAALFVKWTSPSISMDEFFVSMRLIVFVWGLAGISSWLINKRN